MKSTASRTASSGQTGLDSGSVVRNHLLPVLGYALITAVVTYPTAFRLATHIPGKGDSPWFLWQLWWFKRAILVLGRSPLTTDRIYYPLTDVPVNWQTPINELFTLPLHLASNVVILYNLLILGTFVLSGYFMYLLVWRVVGRRDLAFVGGLIFAFSTYHAIRSLHHLSLATTQWLPLSLALLIGWWHKPSWNRALAAGIGIALVALSSPYYVAYFLLPVALVGGAYIVLWQRGSLRRGQIWKTGIGAGLAAALLTAPFYIDYLQSPADLALAAERAAAASYIYTADVLSWLLPASDNPLWQNLTASIYAVYSEHYRTETALFFGFVPLALAVVSYFYRKWPYRQVTFWKGLTLLTLLLSFGPVLRIGSHPVLRWMPYRLFMLLPGAYAFRAPARMGLTTILAATMLAMFVLARWMEKRPTWPWRPLLAVWSLLLLLNLSVGFPYPSASTAIPEVYEDIAATPGDFAILDLPAGEVFLDKMSWYMYYQTYHGKRLVSGYLGRRPERLHQQEQTMPFVKRFFIRDWDSFFAGDWEKLVGWPSAEEITREGWPDDVRDAPALLDDLGIRFVVLHDDPANHGFYQAAARLLALALGPPQYQDETTLRFVSAPGLQRHGDRVLFDRVQGELPFHLLDPGISASGTISLTTPIAGSWIIRGILEGESAPQVEFSLDGDLIEVRPVQLFDETYAFSIQGDLDAGAHTLTLTLPDRDSGSGPLSVSELLLQLASPAAAATPPAIASFIDEQDRRFDLLDVQVIRAAGPDSADQLVTTWLGAAEAESGPQSDDYPTLFVHLTDDQGRQLSQADHMLGVDSLSMRPDDQNILIIDSVALPESDPDVELRIGLWYPQTGAYYWLLDTEQADSTGRLRLGTIQGLGGEGDR